MFLNKSLKRIKISTIHALIKSKTSKQPTYRFASVQEKQQKNIKTDKEQPISEELENEYLELTREQIDRMIKDRKDQLKTINQEKKIPYGALFSALAITSPLVLGSIGITYSCIHDTFLQPLPMLFINYIKYAGLHISFMVIIAIAYYS